MFETSDCIKKYKLGKNHGNNYYGIKMLRINAGMHGKKEMRNYRMKFSTDENSSV